MRSISAGHLVRPMLLAFAAVAFFGTSFTADAADAADSSGPAERTYNARGSDSEPVQGRIVGGRQISVTAAPWQVMVTLLLPNGQEGSCGGAVLNATTVVTAAHCVTNSTAPPNLDILPAAITVDAGVSRFDPNTGQPQAQPGDNEQTVGVITNRVHPGYPRNLANGSGTLADFVDDVAVLTLDAPLDLSQPAVRPISLTAQNVLSPIGAGGTVTGFGLQGENPDVVNGNLFALDEAVQDGSLTAAGPLNALFVVGVAPAGSFCSGDSGSALAVGGALLGVVSSSVSCAGAQPNYYTNVSAAEIQQFILGIPSPPLAPRGGQDVTLRGPRSAPTKGDTLTCSAGTWSNLPAFTYVFADTSTNTELQRGPSTTYSVTGVSDLGATISCRALAANAGGVGLTPPTGTPPAVVAPPKPSPTPDKAKPARNRLSLSLRASVVRPARSGAKRRARTSAPAVRVRRGQRLTFTLGLRNTGNRRQTTVRRCVKLSSRFTLVRRGGGTVSGGRICYSSRSLNPGRLSRRRFVVRVDRDAPLGRLVATASARSRQGADARARQTLFVRPTATRVRPRPPGVTG